MASLAPTLTPASPLAGLASTKAAAEVTTEAPASFHIDNIGFEELRDYGLLRLQVFNRAQKSAGPLAREN